MPCLRLLILLLKDSQLPDSYLYPHMPQGVRTTRGRLYRIIFLVTGAVTMKPE